MNLSSRKSLPVWLMGAAVLIGLAWWIHWSGTPWSSQSGRFTVTAGSAAGRRHAIAESLAQYAQREAIDLNVVVTSGSREALQKVQDNEINFALVQGGLAQTDYPDVRQVAVLHLEPLHLLVKPTPETAEQSFLTLADLSGEFGQRSNLRINVSDKGSGTYVLSTVLLNFFGLTAGEDYQETTLKYKQLMSPTVETRDLPDAVFTVSSLPSPVARHLITQHGFRPVELPVAEAFRLDWSQVSGNEDVDQRIIREYIADATIPAFTYQVNPPVPETPIQTLGTRLHLVANKNTPSAAVEQVADAVYNTAFANTVQPAIVVTLLQSASEFELHSGAADYLKRKTPIITENMVAYTEQVLAILGSLFAGILFVWQALLFSRRRRRDQQFLQCIERVGEIEQKTYQHKRDEGAGIGVLIDLQGELNQIKVDMIQQFQSGDIEGADTLSGFLMHVNNANENLTRLILHERGHQPGKHMPNQSH